MKNDDKKTALKLLNKYADSYSILEEENKCLKSQIKDLKINLNINKDIIQGFIQNHNNEDRSKLYNQKIKEEVNFLTSSLINTTKEKDEIIAKVILYKSRWLRKNKFY
jgi:hypothetical protein